MGNAILPLCLLPKRYDLNWCVSCIAIYTTLFAGFIGNSILGILFAFLIIMINGNRLKLTVFQFFSITFFVAYIFIAITFSLTPEIVLQNIRYWFGVLLYILFFKLYPDNRLISWWFIRFLILLILFESLLINIFNVDSAMFHSGSNEVGIKLAGYERPLSFTGNASTTSIALLTLFYLVEKLLCIKATIIDLFLLSIAIISLMSGVAVLGFILMMLFRVYDTRTKQHGLWIGGIVFLVLIIFLLFYVDFSEYQKLDINYYIEIYYLKGEQVDFISRAHDDLSYLFGTQLNDIEPTTSGDFGWLLFYSSLGLLGIVSYFLIIFSFSYGGGAFLPVLLIMMIGTIHYPAAMSPAGQMITAMVLILPRAYKNLDMCSRSKNKRFGYA